MSKTDAPPELLPTIRKRFERALATALNLTGQSAGSPKVMLEISDVHYLLKWLDTAAPAGQGDCEELRRRDAEDWVETDTAIRELCRPYTDVDGNSYAVPDIVSVVEVAIKKLTARATTPSPAPDAVRQAWDQAIAVVKGQAFRWRHTNQIVTALESARDAAVAAPAPDTGEAPDQWEIAERIVGELRMVADVSIAGCCEAEATRRIAAIIEAELGELK